MNCLSSYTEQRDIAAREGFRYLADHPLAANISNRVAALVPVVPDVSQLTAIPKSAWSTAMPITTPNGPITLGFDGITGAFSTVEIAGVNWADASHTLGQYLYKTFNDTDYAANPTCCYGEANRQKVANPIQSTTFGTMTGLYVDSTSNPRNLVASLSMPDLQHTYYGAPSEIWLTVMVSDDASISVEVQMFNVTATRLGGAHFYHFGPTSQPGDYEWRMDKLGSWVDPLDTVANGGIHQHGVSDLGVRYASVSQPDKYLSIQTIDAAIVDPFTSSNPPSMFPYPLSPLTGPVLGFDVQLMQNAFNTNTPLFTWDTAFKWRFVISASSG